MNQPVAAADLADLADLAIGTDFCIDGPPVANQPTA
jgi:hypothetical protein